MRKQPIRLRSGQVGFISIIVTIIITALLVGGGTYVLEKNASEELVKKAVQENTKNVQQQAQIQIEKLAERIEELEKETKEVALVDNDEQTYINEDWGFSLNFPELWKGYTVKEREGNLSYGEMLDFGLRQQNDIFVIVRFGKSKWKQTQSEVGPKPKYITENKEYVFAYNQAQDTFEDLIPVAKLAPSIIKSFKFLDSNTSDWQTYSNDEYKYSIQHPTEYLVSGSSKDVTLTKIIPASEINVLGGSHSIYVKFLDGNDGDVYNGLYAWAISGFPQVEKYSYLYNKKAVDINGEQFFAFNEASGMDGVRSYLLVKGDVVWYIRGSLLGCHDFVLNHQIISTFKFTDNNTTAWQFYTNEKHNFSFKYPGNWHIFSDGEFGMSAGVAIGDRPLMILKVNPDGFGPHFPDKIFKVERSNGHLLVIDEEVCDNGENDNADIYQVIVDENSDAGLPFFWMSFTDDSGNEDVWDGTVRKIINSLGLLD